jgi:hypothetical protein
MLRRCALAAVVIFLAACGRPAGTKLSPHEVTAIRSAWPRAAIAAPGAPPRILALWMNETAIAPGTQWIGRIATTTNTASVEIRTESFSFNATRRAFGQFTFAQHVLDIVPQYKRGYTLLVIARNAAGEQDVALVPIELR